MLILLSLGSLRPDLSPWYRCFLVALCCLNLGRLNLVVDQFKRLLHQQVKKYQGSLSAMAHMEVFPYSCFPNFLQNWQENTCARISFLIKLEAWGLNISGGCFFHLLQQDFSLMVTKIILIIDVSWTHSLPFCFWQYYQKDKNQITLNHTAL